MAGTAYIGQNKEVILDTKRNLFGLTDVTSILRHGTTSPSSKTIALSEIVDDITNPITLTLSQDIKLFDTQAHVSDASGVQKLMVFKFTDGTYTFYNMVVDIDTVSNTVTFKNRFVTADFQGDSNAGSTSGTVDTVVFSASGTTVTQVGNTGFYKGVWTVSQTDFGDNLAYGDTVLVDVSSVTGGFNFEGQSIVIDVDSLANYQDVRNRLTTIHDLLNELSGGSSYVDVSRILV